MEEGASLLMPSHKRILTPPCGEWGPWERLLGGAGPNSSRFTKLAKKRCIDENKHPNRRSMLLLLFLLTCRTEEEDSNCYCGDQDPPLHLQDSHDHLGAPLCSWPGHTRSLGRTPALTPDSDRGKVFFSEKQRQSSGSSRGIASLTPTFLSSSPTMLRADILADVVRGVPVRPSPKRKKYR